MAVALRQSACLPDSRDWLTLDQAAEQTGESVRTWRWRARGELQAARREHRQALAMKVGKTWHVHRSLDSRLTRYPASATRDDRARASLLARYPSHKVDLAYRRAHWLGQWRERCGGRRGNGETEIDLASAVVCDAKRVEGDAFVISVRGLQAWRRDYERTGSDGQIAGVEGLIDRRGIAGVADAGENDGRHSEAVEYFHSLYRTESKLGIRLCHEATVRQARKNRWAWPAGYASTTRRLRAHDDLSISYLMRFGKDRWARKFLSHLEVDYGTIGPGDLYVCDHHEVDWWCTYKGRKIRPWLTAIQDCRSRCIVGWHLGPAPHQDAIVVSMRRAFRDWAIPVKTRIDDGKDYCSKLIAGLTKAQRAALRRELGRDWRRIIQRNAKGDDRIDSRWLGIAGELGIDLIHAIAYSPWSKGTLERWFGTMEGQHGAPTYVTYCGDSAVNKLECLDEIRRGYSKDQRRRLKKLYGDDWRRHVVLKFVDQAAIPTLEDCRKQLGDWIEVYHNTCHRGRDMQGATPLTVWNTASELRRAVDDDLLCLMDARGVYRVQANGVRVTVGADTVGYGKRCQTLQRYVGRDVLILLNPDDVSHCWAFTPNREKRTPIARLEANEPIPQNTTADDVREAIAEQMRERSVMHKAQRSSARRTRTQVQRIKEHSAARLAELRATGTDDTLGPQAAIVPVRTGFEGLSRPARTDFDYRPQDDGQIEDLFATDDPLVNVADDVEDDQDMDDLFDDTDDDSEPDDGLEGLL